jgi:hypothetical protein
MTFHYDGGRGAARRFLVVWGTCVEDGVVCGGETGGAG